MGKIRYAHLLTTGAGANEQRYIFINHLATGTQGHVMRVLNLADRKVYVLKVSLASEERSEGYANLEVHVANSIIDSIRKTQPNTLNPPLVPRFIGAGTGEYHELVGSDYQRKVMTIWQYCNGGNLAQLFYKFTCEDIPFPPAAAWKCLSQLLETVAFLQQMKPRAIVHGDLQEINMFVHWPNEGDLPDFYVGDFGYARHIPEGSPCTFDSEPGRRAYIGDDLTLLASTLSCIPSGSGASGTQSAKWFHDFRHVLKQLRKLGHSARTRLRFPDLTDILQYVREQASSPEYAQFEPFRHWAKPRHPMEPTYYDTIGKSHVVR